ncbi:MAG TPA: hypothetical protein VFN67_19570 [Polyangiales bacterium]|nr:hypothetical protein [Polyangiales bacterium]
MVGETLCQPAAASLTLNRDIKPANLFLVGDDVNNAKLLDFGPAQRVSERPELVHTTSVVGTPQYNAR